jgi:peptidoglycan/LPS O-acetylase OafA/YrhL
VVFYHLNAGGFASGFLGVDIFFVISGYLMAAMYDPQRKLSFLLKRAKRLLPAYFATVLVTLLAAAILTTPNDYKQVTNQALFASAFAANIGFWLGNSYFEKDAFKLLLHLWSLGVEIQFYLLVPLVCWISERFRSLYILLALASALFCFAVLGVSPKTSFYWLPFRLWEFLIGFGIVKYAGKSVASGNSWRTWIGGAALAAILLIPLIRADGMAMGFTAGHPGLAALLVCLATAVTLVFGLPGKIAESSTFTLLERIGTYSYSIYLVHFPLIVLFLYQPFQGTQLRPSSPGSALLIAAAIALSSLALFTFVEQPLRKGSQSLRFVAVSAAIVLGAGLTGPAIQTLIIPEREMLVYEAWFDRDVYRCGKLMRIAHPAAITCEITQPLASPAHRVLLTGNSFADSIKAAFAAAAQAKNVQVLFTVENAPLRTGGMSPQDLIAEARRSNVDAIVLHYSPGGLDSAALQTLVTLAKVEGLKLSYIMPPPVYPEGVPHMLWRTIRGGGSPSLLTIDDYQRSNSFLSRDLTQIDYDRFHVYEVANVLCTPICKITDSNGKPLYFDNGHMTLTGASMLTEVFERVIAGLGPGRKNAGRTAGL